MEHGADWFQCLVPGSWRIKGGLERSAERASCAPPPCECGDDRSSDIGQICVGKRGPFGPGIDRTNQRAGKLAQRPKPLPKRIMQLAAVGPYHKHGHELHYSFWERLG